MMHQRLKSSLNGFSFNAPLMDGSMDIIDMLEFCAEVGLTASTSQDTIFKGYPLPPERDYLYSIKRKAHALGIEISVTGVCNDFTIPDKILVPRNNAYSAWVDVAARLGPRCCEYSRTRKTRRLYTCPDHRNGCWRIYDDVEYGK
ncbi:MAG: hypothetical protein IPK94_00865 [Saprospiraceae bacterium]|nr:hypothetical protein [Saprospiraceae bacterium]